MGSVSISLGNSLWLSSVGDVVSSGGLPLLKDRLAKLGQSARGTWWWYSLDCWKAGWRDRASLHAAHGSVVLSTVARQAGGVGSVSMWLMVLCSQVPPGVQLSPCCLDLLRRLLTTDPAQRITLQQVSRVPAHHCPCPAHHAAASESCACSPLPLPSTSCCSE